MPVRDRLSTFIAERFIGGHQFNGATGECVTAPTDEYELARDSADLLYEWLVERIDFNRILIEASSRHQRLLLAGGHLDQGVIDEVCGACIREALLACDWSPDDVPAAPRRYAGQDFAAALARSVKFRQNR